MQKIILVVFISVLGILNLSSCYAARIDGPYEGKVIDADTGQPIEGVVVLGTWSRETPTPGGATHNFYDAQETVTDKNGEFKIKGLGLLVISNVIPMDVLIFKAGYEYLGTPWESLKKSKYLIQKKNIKWEGDRVIIPLKKVTMEERKKDPLYPPIPPTEAPLEKARLMLKEINKDLVQHGFEPMEIWRGKKI
ncbi:MAG: hypothetical protein AB1632_05330 [Nitrospirota bacterium]